MNKVDYLRDKPIAVLGAGAIGKSCAGDCALAGNRVRICDIEPFAKKTLNQVAEQGIKVYGFQHSLYGFERSGCGKMEMVTTDIAEAVKGAGIILITTPALGHKTFFEKLIPALEDGQVIHIIPDNFGTLILRKMMREAGCNKKVIVGGWSSAPYGCRVDNEGGVIFPRVGLKYRAITLRGAALPMSDTDILLESTKLLGCFDAITNGDGPAAAKTVLDTCFTNVNPVLHVPGTVLGVSTMENWGKIFGTFDKKDYSIYSHAFCPSISRVQYAFYQEEIALAEAIGVGIQTYDEDQFFNRRSVLAEEYMGKEYRVPFDEQAYVAIGSGPHSINHRYITEDVPVGCRIYHELGKAYDVKTPVIDSMITIASVMIGKNYFEEGYNLEYLGLNDMTKEELLAYLNEGILK